MPELIEKNSSTNPTQVSSTRSFASCRSSATRGLINTSMMIGKGNHTTGIAWVKK
ncbi:hypothetical protein D9M68_886650 [compost metagenome]